MILSCAAEESNPIISRDYHLLRRMIDTEECFIEVTALGEDLAMDVIRCIEISKTDTKISLAKVLN